MFNTVLERHKITLTDDGETELVLEKRGKGIRFGLKEKILINVKHKRLMKEKLT